jgi:hypothetical protein
MVQREMGILSITKRRPCFDDSFIRPRSNRWSVQRIESAYAPEETSLRQVVDNETEAVRSGTCRIKAREAHVKLIKGEGPISLQAIPEESDSGPETDKFRVQDRSASSERVTKDADLRLCGLLWNANPSRYSWMTTMF